MRHSLACITIVILLCLGSCAVSDNTSDDLDYDEALTYDYVIIGAGSAGCVVAEGLTDNMQTSVLVIEAGPNRDADENVIQPANYGYVATGPFYNFDYFTNPVQRIGNRRTDAAQGRMWGGSGSHNGMIYVRGNDYDYTRWAPYGEGKWTPARVNHVFKQLENNSLHFVDNATEFLRYHGVGGRVDTLNDRPQQDIFDTVAEAMHDVVGIDINVDYNGAKQEGVAKYNQYQQQYNHGSPIRESSSTAFLGDTVRLDQEGDGVGINGRLLRVHSNSYITKIIFNSSQVAQGVEYIKNGKHRTAYVRNDVIISAGSLSTPAVLMRSGIGNCTELASLGISCVYNNPQVGKNLGNHIVFSVFGKKNSSNPFQYFTSVTAFYKSKVADKYTDTSINSGKVEVDTNVLWYPALLNLAGSDQPFVRQLDTVDPVTGAVRDFVGFSMVVALLRPKCNAGRVYLASKDPLAPPVIETPYLCDPQDFEWAITAFNDTVNIINKMSEIDPTIALTYPTPDLMTPQYINNTIRSLIAGYSHYVGTASMGKVVDGSLCVNGVGGLRVIDASVMPYTPTGNTHAPVQMIGKNGADIIKDTTTCRINL